MRRNQRKVTRPSSSAAKAEAPKAAAPPSALPPRAGSHIPPDQNVCIQCHGDPDLWDAKNQRLYIDRDELADDVHWKKGVNCSDCHGGDYQDHGGQRSARQGERISRRGRSGAEDVRRLSREPGAGTGQERPCQGRREGRAGPRHAAAVPSSVTERISTTFSPVTDERSPVFVDHQVKTCGGCHEKERGTYAADRRTATACTNRDCW